MIQRVGTLDSKPSLIAAVGGRKELLYGCGHQIYILAEVRAESHSYDPLSLSPRKTSKDLFFRDRGKRISADFYSNFVCKAM
ncbi:hypothetical protein XPA_009874 [Xanthoria parietina]